MLTPGFLRAPKRRCQDSRGSRTWGAGGGSVRPSLLARRSSNRVQNWLTVGQPIIRWPKSSYAAPHTAQPAPYSSGQMRCNCEHVNMILCLNLKSKSLTLGVVYQLKMFAQMDAVFCVGNVRDHVSSAAGFRRTPGNSARYRCFVVNSVSPAVLPPIYAEQSPEADPPLGPPWKMACPAGFPTAPEQTPRLSPAFFQPAPF